jgi:hypothetical protein
MADLVSRYCTRTAAPGGTPASDRHIIAVDVQHVAFS